MPQTDVCADAPLEGYAFAYLDETTKRMIRRGLLKAVAIPGYQVPFASREMPMPCGWGTGGIQVTASILGRDDVLKVIDQGSDDTTNAVSIRDFFRKTTGVATTTHTDEATIIQTRHRIPEQPLTESQIMVYQVPLPEPLRWLEPSEQETRTLHALEEYGIMNVKLYEDIVRHGTIATGFDYPVRVAGRYIMSPSPIPRFDNPKMHQCPALQLFGAGREKRLYAIPPYTDVESLDFEDYPFTVQSWDEACAICGSTDTYLDEVILDDQGNRMFVCSDTDCCARRAAVPTRGRPAPAHPSGSTNGRSFQPIPASHFAILGILPRLQRVSSASMSRMASRTAQGSGSARRSQSRSHSRHASSRPCCTGYADQQDRNPSRCGCPSRRGPPGKEPDEGKGRSALWGAGCPARSPAGCPAGYGA